MKTWNVYKEDGTALGQVQEDNEELARCAALSKFERPEDEPNRHTRFVIEAWEDFSVSLA